MMMQARLLPTFFVALWLVQVAACVGMSQPTASPHGDDSTVEAGRQIAQDNCSSCHAIGRNGDSPNPTSPPFRTLSQRYPIESLSESFAEGVFIGHPLMPEFRLEPEAVDSLLAYLAAIQE
jgi:cytochrome c